MCVHERPADRIVSGRIRERGCWECSLRDLILKTLSVHANATFVDIGANIGAHTIAMAASGAAQHVYALLQGDEAHHPNLLARVLGVAVRDHAPAQPSRLSGTSI